MPLQRQQQRPAQHLLSSGPLCAVPSSGAKWPCGMGIVGARFAAELGLPLVPPRLCQPSWRPPIHPSIHSFWVSACLPAGPCLVPSRRAAFVSVSWCRVRRVVVRCAALRCPIRATERTRAGHAIAMPCVPYLVGTMSCRYGQRAVVTRRRDSGLASVTCLAWRFEVVEPQQPAAGSFPFYYRLAAQNRTWSEEARPRRIDSIEPNLRAPPRCTVPGPRPQGQALRAQARTSPPPPRPIEPASRRCPASTWKATGPASTIHPPPRPSGPLSAGTRPPRWTSQAPMPFMDHRGRGRPFTHHQLLPPPPGLVAQRAPPGRWAPGLASDWPVSGALSTLPVGPLFPFVWCITQCSAVPGPPSSFDFSPPPAWRACPSPSLLPHHSFFASPSRSIPHPPCSRPIPPVAWCPFVLALFSILFFFLAWSIPRWLSSSRAPERRASISTRRAAAIAQATETRGSKPRQRLLSHRPALPSRRFTFTPNQQG